MCSNTFSLQQRENRSRELGHCGRQDESYSTSDVVHSWTHHPVNCTLQ